MSRSASEARLVSRGPQDTQAIGAAIAPLLEPGDVVALSGDLGAGKTCFVQGAARGLDVPDRVTSPSFVLVREYEGRIPILHMDVYRLGSLQEVIDLGYEEFLEPTSVVFIEWGDAVSALLPEEWLEVDIRGAEEGERHVVLRPHGRRWAARFADLASRTATWTEAS